MVEALSGAFGREKGDAAALKLRSRCQKQGESLEELSRDIVGLVRRAYSSDDARTSSKITIDEGINAIDDSTVRCKLRDSFPSSIEEALRKAKSYTINLEVEARTHKHNRVDPRIEHLEQQVAALSDQIKQMIQNRPPVRCYHCQGYGHIKKNCPRYRDVGQQGNENGLSTRDPTTLPRPVDQGSERHQ
jgi:aspartate carbamoyltransferase regulatory subunit